VYYALNATTTCNACTPFLGAFYVVQIESVAVSRNLMNHFNLFEINAIL